MLRLLLFTYCAAQQQHDQVVISIVSTVERAVVQFNSTLGEEEQLVGRPQSEAVEKVNTELYGCVSSVSLYWLGKCF